MEIAEDYCRSVLKKREEPLCAEVLGRLCEKTDKTKDRAIGYYEAACKDSDIRYSLLRLAELYRNSDAEKSNTYILRCAESGIPEMMLKASQIYKEGNGINADKVKSNSLRLRAYDIGYADAAYEQAVILAGDRFDESCLASARKSAALSAKYGGSQLKLYQGKRYVTANDYVYIDLNKAEKWYGYAAEMQSREAYDELGSLVWSSGNPLRMLYWYIKKYSLLSEVSENNSTVKSTVAGTVPGYFKECSTSFYIRTILNSMRNEAEPAEPSEKALEALHKVIAKVGDAAPETIGYMLYDTLRETGYLGFVTDVYIAYACGAYDILREDGAEKAAAHFAQTAFISENKALKVIKYLSGVADMTNR